MHESFWRSQPNNMFCFFKLLLLLLIFLISFLGAHCSSLGGRIFSFNMHHRFSDPVKKFSETAGSRLSPAPAKGSIEYYADLADRDRILRGRKLSELHEPLAFSDGNSTLRISSLGFLHYTTVQLGTPGVKFMVALDTGSDLFWVPCDCSRCAPTEGTVYASDFELNIYNPKGSSTSRNVTCNNSLCAHRSRCIGTFDNCPYMVSYVSAETSTSGILVEDVLHLTAEDSYHELFEAYITFGCGQVQSGSFLDVAAPNGLFGLGMEKISVPSILSSEGFTADSFSMCFGHDGIGRISFGDKGSPDQEETPFNLNPSHPNYNISVTQLRVGKTLIDVDFTALFDSGTSFTYLVEPTYARLAESFHSQAQDKRHPPDSRIPFEYCYDMRFHLVISILQFGFYPPYLKLFFIVGSPRANASLIPSMSLTMKGGSQFAIHEPIIVINSQTELVYCLAVVKSRELNIIGQNLMTGYRVVFDREKLVLGWKKFDCYDKEDHNISPTKPHGTTVPPAVAVGLGNSSTPESTKETGYSSHGSAAWPLFCSHTSLTYFRFLITLFLLL